MLENFAKAKEYDKYEFYVDGGYSGKNLERPAINKLIKDVENHKIDCVMVFKLDRISRSQRDTLYLIEEVFNKNKVGFISIRENFDTTTPFGKAMIGILSVFAQLERETILERTKIGIKKRAENGFWRGGGKIPFPYTYNKKLGILIPNPEMVRVLHKMINMYINGLSFNKIGLIVGMDESLVEKRILSRTNMGIIPYKGMEFKGRHKAVISKDLYNKIIEIKEVRRKNKNARHYLLSGKLICGFCGAKYRYQKWGKRIVCYCYSQQRSKPKYVKDSNCKNSRFDSYEIEDIVLENIFLLKLDEELIKKYFSFNEYDLKNEYDNRILDITNRIKKLLDFISNGIAVEETLSKISVLKKQEEKMKLELKKIEIEDNIKKRCSSKTLKSVWNLMVFEEKKMIIDLLIEKVVIYNNNIDIYYKLT